MIEVKEDLFVESLQELEGGLPGRGQRWVRDLRRSAFERFADLGLPTTRHEDWKYTNVAPIGRIQFQPACQVEAEDAPGSLRRLPLVDLGLPQLVYINGRYSLEHSTAHSLPSGVKFRSLRDLLETGDETLSGHLARYAGYGKHAFTALNTAFLDDGVFLHVERGAVVEQPVLIVFLTAAGETPVASQPRVLVLAERESHVAVIEVHASVGEGERFTNAVTEVAVEEGAIVEHYKVQVEAPRAYHVATVQFHQARSSTALSHNVCFGGALARNDINSVLDGEGAECTLNGLYLGRGSQLIDNHTELDHARPHCASREYYKGVLDGNSTGVFNGKIIVRQDAQKTDAIQSNKNLLLSAGAVINTKPQLEIWADDVRCTHGATVGQLDQDSIFYLQSRGIDRAAARELLTYAFAADVLGRMKVAPVREWLEKELFERLS